MTSQESYFNVMTDKMKDQRSVLEGIRTRRMFVIAIQLILFITLTMMWNDPGHRLAIFGGAFFCTYKGLKGLSKVTWQELDWTNLNYIDHVGSGSLENADYFKGIIRTSSNLILMNSGILDEEKIKLEKYIGLSTLLLIFYVFYAIVLKLFFGR